MRHFRGLETFPSTAPSKKNLNSHKFNLEQETKTCSHCQEELFLTIDKKQQGCIKQSLYPNWTESVWVYRSSSDNLNPQQNCGKFANMFKHLDYRMSGKHMHNCTKENCCYWWVVSHGILILVKKNSQSSLYFQRLKPLSCRGSHFSCTVAAKDFCLFQLNYILLVWTLKTFCYRREWMKCNIKIKLNFYCLLLISCISISKLLLGTHIVN